MLSPWGGKASHGSCGVRHRWKGIPTAGGMTCLWLQNKTDPQNAEILIFLGGRMLYCFFIPLFLFCFGWRAN